MEENTVRLVEGTGNNTGFVELYSLGQWVPICPDFWDILDASVVCRELGYLTAVSTTVKIRYNYQHYRGFTTYTFSCTGDESTLKQCSTSDRRYCNPYYYSSQSSRYYYYLAFVNCSGESIRDAMFCKNNYVQIFDHRKHICTKLIIRCLIHCH